MRVYWAWIKRYCILCSKTYRTLRSLVVTFRCFTTSCQGRQHLWHWSIDRAISQSPWCTSPISTMQHFVTEMCTCVHISVTKCCIVGYLWDLWDGSIPVPVWEDNFAPFFSFFFLFVSSFPIPVEMNKMIPVNSDKFEYQFNQECNLFTFIMVTSGIVLSWPTDKNLNLMTRNLMLSPFPAMYVIRVMLFE